MTLATLSSTAEAQDGVAIRDFTLEARAREIAVRLTEWPSVTGTRDEATFSLKLGALLREIPYFTANPDDLVVAPIPGDPLGRSNVFAHVRGRGSKTVLLSGHFDVVPVDDYGELAPLAFSPDALLPALVERLQRTGAHPQALADLTSGEFLPGRGLLDMKSGVAAGIAVLEAFAADPGREGNLVLLATPDEEDRSAGMRAAADILPGWMAARGLDVALDVNLDAICDHGDGTTGRVAAFGCIGKLLLSAFVVGKEAHAAYPLDGVNAGYLAAELVTEIEFAPELGEDAGGELASPPTVLGSRDLKGQYNVTIPGAVWTFWNVLTHRRKAAEVLDIGRTLARRAADRAEARMRERAGRLKVGVNPVEAWGRIKVLTVAEVNAEARRRVSDLDARLAALGEELAAQPELDLPTRSRRLIEEAWAASGLEGPAIVLGFGSMPYPAIAWPEEAGAVRTAVEAAMVETSAAEGVSLGSLDYFPAIADMSFVGVADAADLRDAAANTPIWGSSIRWDVSERATPGYPSVNIGPWGRDYHHWLERVHAPYAFGTLPRLLQAVTRRVLALS